MTNQNFIMCLSNNFLLAYFTCKQDINLKIMLDAVLPLSTQNNFIESPILGSERLSNGLPNNSVYGSNPIWYGKSVEKGSTPDVYLHLSDLRTIKQRLCPFCST